MSVQTLLLRVPSSFWRFGLVGVGGLFVDMVVLYAAMWGLGLAPVPAKVVSFLAAATFTWWMNRRYTFGHSGKALLHEWASFLATNAFGGAVNFAVYTALVTQLPPYAWMPALATAIGSLSGLLFNYLGSRHLVFKPKATQAGFREDALPLPWATYPLTLSVCLSFGGVALWLGMDANWDLLNYHWYNGWAFLHGLLGRDVLAAQPPSFYNPTLDVPYAWAVERLPARAIGFILGMAHGLNFLPLFAIAWRLSTLADPRWRLATSAGAALAGIVGGEGLAEVGTVFYDNVLSLFVFTSIWVVVSRWDTLTQGGGLGRLAWAVAAGFPAGLAFGLKQPMVVFCVGLCAAFLAAGIPWPRRIAVGFWFGIGVLLGFALGGGHWAWHLWQVYGNPLFPYFNQFFHSPWAMAVDYNNLQFVPRSLIDKLLFVYRFSFNTYLTGEIDFRDFRVMALMTLLPLAALAWFWRRQPRPFTRPGPTGWLLVASLLAYALWLNMFAIYRYLMPLEMLAPVLIVASIGMLPLPGKARHYAAAGLLGILAVSTVRGDWMRVPWEEQAVRVDGVEALSLPEGTLVLLSSHEPLSFLIPAFPKHLRFYRIDSTFTLPDDPAIGFRKLFGNAIEANTGPIASLHLVGMEHEVVKKLADYGLELDQSHCQPISSPISQGEFAYCLVRKTDALTQR